MKIQYYVTGHEAGGSLGALPVVVDWQARVFGLSIIVDIPCFRLYIHAILLYGCIDRRSCYTPYSS